METQRALTHLHQVIGERVKLFRMAKGYNQEELAYRAGINTSHLSKIERGAVNFTLSSLDKILLALEVPYPAFFQLDTVPVPEADPIIEKTAASMRNMVLREQQCIYEIAQLLEMQKKGKANPPK